MRNKSEKMDLKQLVKDVQNAKLPAARRNSQREELKFRKSQVSFNEGDNSKLAINSNSTLTSH